MRFLATLALSLGLAPTLVAPAAVEPRDTETVIESVSPGLPEGVTLEVLGFDSYLRLRAPGRDVSVPGYDNEPYLRIDRDGSVWANEMSPTWALNTDRFGNVDLTGFSASSTPAWVRTSRDATALWHDHRVHWMSPQKPGVLDDRGTIQDFELAVIVDGTTHVVRGALYLRERASIAWWLSGLVATAAMVVFAVRRRRAFMWSAPVVGAAAAVVGVAQWLGTDPGARVVPLLAAFGALASLVGVVALLSGRANSARAALMSAALNAGSGASLVVVAVLTADHVQSAWLPGLEWGGNDWSWIARTLVPIVLATGVVTTIDGVARVVRGDVRD